MDWRRHPCFESGRDPRSGAESFVLRERGAPVQQSFYFTSTPLTGDEQWLWFYIAFPPAPAHSPGVVVLDPHPPFSPRGTTVIGTTVVADGVTVALTADESLR